MFRTRFSLKISLLSLLVLALLPLLSHSAQQQFIVNGNFTGGSSAGWTYAETDPSSVATSNFAAAGGNFDPGAWYFQVVDNSNAQTYTVTGNLTNDGGTWSGTGLISATAVFAYRQKWATLAPTTNTISVYLVRSDNSEALLFTRSSTADDAGYTFAAVSIGTGNFSAAGAYKLKMYNYVVTPQLGKPTVNNSWDDIALTLVYDSTPPAWSGNKTNFTTLAYSPNPVSLIFNTTWNDADTSVSAVLIEHNLTGAPANYTVSDSSGAEYYYTWTGILGAGSYAWKEYANDTMSNMNATDTFYFTVGKAASSIYLYLNGSRANFEIGGGSDLNTTAALQTPSSGTVSIRTNYSDGIDKEWDVGASPLENTTAPPVAGTYYFNATFSGNENYTSSNELWIATVLQPYLEVNLTYPPSPSDAIQNYTFRVNASVTCRQGNCGTVNGTVRYNATSQNPDTTVSTTYGATPLFVNETPASAEKTCGVMGADDSCNLSWVLNATGDIGASVKVGVLFNGTAPGMAENHTENATINIVSCVVDISTSWAGIDFGDKLPNTAEHNASGNDAGLYNITVNEGSCDTDIYIKGTNLTNETFGSYIPVVNISWNNVSNSYSSAHKMQLSYLPVKYGALMNTNVTTWYWLDVPPVYAGHYNGTVYILGVKDGQSPP